MILPAARIKKILIDHHYFVSQSIDTAIETIGRQPLSHPVIPRVETTYSWCRGDDCVSLITDGHGCIVDYIPPHAAREDVLAFCRTHADDLAGWKLSAVVKEIGYPHSACSFDFGVEVSSWRLPSKSRVNIWTRNGVVTDLDLKPT